MSSYRLPERRSIRPDDSLRNKPSAFSMPINYVVAVGTEHPSGQFFHFRLSLVSWKPGHSESIRIDMCPNLTDPNNMMHGVAVVEYNPYPFSRNYGPEPFWVSVQEGTTADMVLRLIFDERELDQYLFNADGQGCRHWCARVLGALFGSITARDFEAYEIEQHRLFGPKFPMPRITGLFLK